MLKPSTWTVLIALMLIPAAVFGAFEAKSVLNTTVEMPVLDTATGPDDNLVFLLTQKAVLIYSVSDQKVLDRIPLNETYDHLAVLDDERLVVTDSASSRVNVISFNQVFEIDLTDRAFKGPADAPVTLVVFDDYQCPYCSRLERFVEQILLQYPDEVKYVIKHYPLPSHPFARRAAMAALAAGKQGKFWEFHARALENHNRMSEEKIGEIATELELDMDAFKKDRELAESRRLIDADIQNGKAVGVGGTPSVFLNGKRIANRNLSKLPELIERELKP